MNPDFETNKMDVQNTQADFALAAWEADNQAAARDRAVLEAVLTGLAGI